MINHIVSAVFVPGFFIGFGNNVFVPASPGKGLFCKGNILMGIKQQHKAVNLQ